jgi:NADPH-dependent glutamate synthase beta subunit-like oxidoreductase/Pyruvate/2-oxoacid:ferredoxin oxidoreductase delta subunit
MSTPDKTTRDMTASLNPDKYAKGTGALRSRRPIYMDYLPPCNEACPAGEDIQGWLDLAQAGNYHAAWQKLIENNPFPSIHGRVCYHPCESACNRNQTDTEVSIHAVERFLGDMAMQKDWKPEFKAKPGGKRVLVVGGGPSGLSAAYHLIRLGHQVEIYEAGPVMGGMIHFGIPAYRMPRAELKKEIQRVADMGAIFHLNRRVDDIGAEMTAGNFDASFVAVGAHISKNINIPAREARQMMDAVSFLKSVEKGEEVQLGRRVAIYGGGNTAMDAARVAKRMGVDEAMIIYRRDRENMAAHDFEAAEALEEGVKINWLRTIKEIDGSTIEVEIMKLGDDGRPYPTGEFEKLEADSLIMAVGQDTDTGFLDKVDGIAFKPDGTVIVGENMMTGAEGIFAGGDMIPSERSVTIATGHGKKAARYINAWLRNESYAPLPKHPIVSHEKLQLWYRTYAPMTKQENLPLHERLGGFEEIMRGISEKEANYEAKRCLSCGNCFECDGCYGSCPENAIIKLGPGKKYRFEYALCTGCGVCQEQCPCHAIEMIPEVRAANVTGQAPENPDR